MPPPHLISSDQSVQTLVTTLFTQLILLIIYYARTVIGLNPVQKTNVPENFTASRLPLVPLNPADNLSTARRANASDSTSTNKPFISLMLGHCQAGLCVLLKQKIRLSF
jgi:hypothetical protein